MGEGEPAGSVGEEGGVDAVLVEGLMNLGEPLDDAVGEDGMASGEGSKPAGFVFERAGGYAAEDEAEDEEGEPEADGAQELALSGVRRGAEAASSRNRSLCGWQETMQRDLKRMYGSHLFVGSLCEKGCVDYRHAGICTENSAGVQRLRLGRTSDVSVVAGFIGGCRWAGMSDPREEHYETFPLFQDDWACNDLFPRLE